MPSLVARPLVARSSAQASPRPASSPWFSWLAGGARSSSGRYLVLPRAPARTLARHDLAAQEQLAAPDSPRLPSLERACEARHPRRAAPAQELRALHVRRGLGEEQVRVVRAGKLVTAWHPGDRGRDGSGGLGRLDNR